MNNQQNLQWIWNIINPPTKSNVSSYESVRA